MADEPISGLQLIGTPPYSSNFTTNNPTGGTSSTGGAQLEILDTTNQTMASTGTNSRIFPGDLIMGYLAAGSNVTLTETAGIVTIAAAAGLPGGATNGQVLTEVSGAPAWANPVTKSSVVGQLSSASYNLTTSFANIGLSVNLPAAGTYILRGSIRAFVDVQGSNTATDGATVQCQLYDSTASSVIANSVSLIVNSYVFVTGVGQLFCAMSPIGPVLYTVTVPTTVNIQGKYTLIGGASIVGFGTQINSDSNGYTSLSAIRVY